MSRWSCVYRARTRRHPQGFIIPGAQLRFNTTFLNNLSLEECCSFRDFFCMPPKSSASSAHKSCQNIICTIKPVFLFIIFAIFINKESNHAILFIKTLILINKKQENEALIVILAPAIFCFVTNGRKGIRHCECLISK